MIALATSESSLDQKAKTASRPTQTLPASSSSKSSATSRSSDRAHNHRHKRQWFDNHDGWNRSDECASRTTWTVLSTQYPTATTGWTTQTGTTTREEVVNIPVETLYATCPQVQPSPVVNEAITRSTIRSQDEETLTRSRIASQGEFICDERYGTMLMAVVAPAIPPTPSPTSSPTPEYSPEPVPLVHSQSRNPGSRASSISMTASGQHISIAKCCALADLIL